MSTFLPGQAWKSSTSTWPIKRFNTNCTYCRAKGTAPQDSATGGYSHVPKTGPVWKRREPEPPKTRKNMHWAFIVSSEREKAFRYKEVSFQAQSATRSTTRNFFFCPPFNSSCWKGKDCNWASTFLFNEKEYDVNSIFREKKKRFRKALPRAEQSNLQRNPAILEKNSSKTNREPSR